MTVLGIFFPPSVKDIPENVDLAVFTIPAAQMETAIDDCVTRGVKAGVVITAGFKELGGKFADLESELVAKARAGNMLLVGPNCQGVCCPETKLYPWIPPNFHPPLGSVGVISQSGNLQTLLISEVVKSGFGISKSVSSGNEAHLRAEDYFTYLGDDPKTEVIIGYLEGMKQGRLFIEKTRAVAQKNRHPLA